MGLGTTQTLAQCTQEQKLTASDAGVGDKLGLHVSVDGDTAIVGASLDDCAAGLKCGAAYVFRFNGTSWVQEQKLTASDAAAHDRFGSSVSVSGDTTVVGAKEAGCAAGGSCGAAYVFRFNGTSWVEEQKLTASDAAPLDRFGLSVAVSADTAMIGAPSDDCASGSNCGAAYVFRFNGTVWVQEQKLAASDAGMEDFFSNSVSVSAGTAVVGANAHDCAAGLNCGAAYVFRFNGTSWVQEQKLTASDAARGGDFGMSSSVSGDTTIVGAPGAGCAAGGSCGAAYVFRFNGTSWVEEQKLTASDADFSDDFGISASVSGDTTVVGAFKDDCTADFNNDCGAVYVFRFNGTAWIQAHKLTASDATARDNFGFSVSVSGDTSVVGAPSNDCAAGSDCGAAYVFRCVPGCGDGVVDTGETCDNGAANSDTLSDACRTDCTLPTCGDGVVDTGETCDNGAANSDTLADACRTTCTLPTCGDGVVDTGEACDDGVANSDTLADACRTTCTLPTCGDGVVDTGEACDDGVANSDTLPDACRTTCTLPTCGDGVVDTGEACDDGNTIDTDFCFSTCEINPNPTPTVSQWGLVVMALLILSACTIILRRGREVSA